MQWLKNTVVNGGNELDRKNFMNGLISDHNSDEDKGHIFPIYNKMRLVIEDFNLWLE